MSKKQKKLVVVAAALALCFGIVPTANAMHIMEGYLPPLTVLSGASSVFRSCWQVFSKSIKR